VTAEDLEAEFVRLAGVGELDKIHAYLCSRREKVPRDAVREIVQDACLEVVRRHQDGGRITNVAGLVTTIARRQLDKTWQQIVDGLEIDAALARRQIECGEWRHDDDWHARIERAIGYVSRIVASWPADNLRRTLMVIIDAARQGMQLEARDLDQILGCARGTGRVWRDRAMDRLRAQLEKDGISWEEIVGPLPDIEGYDADEGLERDGDVDEEEI
jgi:DNA-directed RNA polymerase specialized sigma24 family protein